MVFYKKEKWVKAGMLISAVACMLLVTTARSLPLIVWLCGLAALAFVIYRGIAPAAKSVRYLSDLRYDLLGFAVSASVGYTFFYGTWLHSDFVKSAAAASHLPASILTLGCTGVLILLSTPFLTWMLGWLISAAIEDCKALPDREDDDRKNSLTMPKAFALLLLIYLIGISAVIRADFNYIDDLGRVAQGYKEWGFFSRFTSVLLSGFLHMDNYLTDVSPLPQLLAALILTGAGICLMYTVYERKYFSVWEVIAVVPLGLSPYFLECMSYKYDAPYMALSVLGAVFPLLYRKRSTVGFFLAVVAGTLLTCTTYQAAAGIYPMIVILLAVRMLGRGEPLKETILFCIKSAAAYALGLLIFMALVMRPEKTYAGTVAEGGAIISVFIGNLKHYYAIVIADFKPFWLALCALAGCSFVAGTAMRWNGKRWTGGLVAVLALVLMLALCFGVYPAMVDASFDPRAMYGFTAMLSLLALGAVEGEKRLPAKMVVLALSWTFFVFSFTYGNALYVQREYTDYRIQMVIDDLNNIQRADPTEPVRLEITGTVGLSPVLRNMPQDYQMLNRLVPVNFCGGWMWGEYGLHHYYDLKNLVWEEGVLTDPETLPVLEDHMLHTIRGNQECIQVKLK